MARSFNKYSFIENTFEVTLFLFFLKPKICIPFALMCTLFLWYAWLDMLPSFLVISYSLTYSYVVFNPGWNVVMWFSIFHIIFPHILPCSVSCWKVFFYYLHGCFLSFLSSLIIRFSIIIFLIIWFLH